MHLFVRTPPNYWADVNNQRAFMEQLGEKLGFAKGDMERWYAVSSKAIIDHGGESVLLRHHHSIPSLLAAVFPDYKWNELRFSRARRNQWTTLTQQRVFLDALADRLGLPKGDHAAWYNVPAQAIVDGGGSGLLARYNGSMTKLLAAVYSEYEWQLWRFPRRATQVRSDDNAQTALLTEVERTLGLRSAKDWHTVSLSQLQHTHPDLSRALMGLGVDGIVAALRRRYPDEPWESRSFFPIKGWARVSQRPPKLVR